MVVAILYEVEQANFLQVLTASESTILNTDLQVAVRVFRAAVGLPELAMFL